MPRIGAKIAIAVLIAGGHACLTLTGTTTSLFVVILTCRFIRMATVFIGTRFEIRDANGKVVATVPTRIKNVAFDFFQKLKQSNATFFILVGTVATTFPLASRISNLVPIKTVAIRINLQVSMTTNNDVVVPVSVKQACPPAINTAVAIRPRIWLT